VTNKDAATLAQVIEAFALMPLHGHAEVNGKALRTVLHEATGLSSARIAKGKLDSLRPSTQRKIAIHQEQWLKEQAGESSELLASMQASIATTPKTTSGGMGQWAGWVHGFEQMPELPLARSKQVALVVDELIDALMNACLADHLAAYRQELLKHFEQHGSPVRLEGEPLAPLESNTREVKGLSNWQEARVLTSKLFDNLYLDMLTALDVEWSNLVFGKKQVPPLFPLVMPKAKDGLELGVVPASKKNLFIRPTRRLLVFMHALLHMYYRRKWPAKAASPHVLALSLGLEPSDLSNYFDGSRKLTYHKAVNYWRAMCEHFSKGQARLQDMPSLPEPLIWLALYWQQILVKDKERSIILLDTANYLAFWQRRHDLWLGPSKGSAVEWPSWLTGQSSSLP
jgi:hypothetical protein